MAPEMARAGSLVFMPPEAPVDLKGPATWWRFVFGADWRKPLGPAGPDALPDHPAVHIAHVDAAAYARWARKELPSEAEWEYAARGGLEQALYPWGDDLVPDGTHRCNIWQGSFPDFNSMDDGYIGTAPVDAYQPNGFGLYNMAGNVWEWCEDYFSPSYHLNTAAKDPLQTDPSNTRSMRGGSFLCHDSYCNRYRVAARSSNTPDSSSSNIGFRVVQPPR
jgi:formylglycine-generating enzyme required for sulfatase activity